MNSSYNSMMPSYTYQPYTLEQLRDLAKLNDELKSQHEQKVIKKHVTRVTRDQYMKKQANALMAAKLEAQKEDVYGNVAVDDKGNLMRESSTTLGDLLKDVREGVTRLPAIAASNEATLAKLGQLALPSTAAGSSASSTSNDTKLEEIVDDATLTELPFSIDSYDPKPLSGSANTQRTDITYSLSKPGEVKQMKLTINIPKSLLQLHSRDKAHIAAGEVFKHMQADGVYDMYDNNDIDNALYRNVGRLVTQSVVNHSKITFKYKESDGNAIEYAPKQKQEGKGVVVRRPKGHHKSPTGKPLTLEMVDDTTAKFGDKFIEVIPLMTYNTLIIHRVASFDTTPIINEMITSGVVDLLTKRMTSLTNPTDEDLQTFAKIIRVCNVITTASERKSNKYKLVEPFLKDKDDVKATITTQLGEGLDLRSAEGLSEFVRRGLQAIQAGNTNQHLIEEVIRKSERLLKDRAISTDLFQDILADIRDTVAGAPSDDAEDEPEDT